MSEGLGKGNGLPGRGANDLGRSHIGTTQRFRRAGWDGRGSTACFHWV